MAANNVQEPALPPNNPITISTGQILSLLGALIALKFFQAVTYIFRLDKSRKRLLRSPVARAIVRKEQLIIDIFLSIMPEGVFRSPASSATIELTPLSSMDVNRNVPEDDDRTSSDVQSPLIHTAPGMPTALRLWQCGSGCGGLKLFTMNPQNPGLPLPTSKGNTVRLYRASDGVEGKSIGVIHTWSPSANQESILALNQGSAASRVERQQFSPIVRPWSVDSAALPLTNDSHAILEMEEGAKTSRSAESFPGKFPISEGSDAQNLSTMPQCMRGRGVTSVRPFSDL
ncbi:hypothetical protein ETB97_006657 [Aspergillus alliaceus]|uniref:Uncharacterized protein n=1 Tax=Petromyces alliaceus TaxID=209559 RepID=A0A5N6G317_PETAA|nr:uncharacterized protein BDW43DRAFT_267740 [Aspergillus alliaceus]KAB8236177.1 hypothetical protein BDW43DRAFT_267740 [Aspergillus alliaceus]KAE8385511.1 hypothetical protein BDV23DRAFT_164827 [Aspergillus alliaceus]KAF5856833.1 hypothetical protein ETB97_006657 [Aspergillus burnettii]